MTEYTTSSHAFREYMSARDRTARWVQSHSPTESEFYSPSVPPTVIDGLVHSSPPSEADSSHSTPPKMVLRYNDGRPDIPIPHPSHLIGKPGSKTYQTSFQTSSSQSRVRSNSSAELPAYNPSILRRDHESRLPEEIRILPSSGEVPTSSRSSGGHTRSKSLPRSSLRHRPVAPDVPFIPPSHLQTQSPYLGPGPSAAPQEISPPHHVNVNFAPPTQPWPPRHHPKHTPPAIVYAPHQAHQPHYAPPAMFHHPPQMGPNGMIYSHSAPVPGQYRPAYPTPYPSVMGASSRHHPSSSVHDHTRSVGRSTRINPASSSASLTSQTSGSTYYVLPAHGQKVHVINPSPEQSIVTATSTTKSPTTPTFGKRPFLQRLFGFPLFSNAGSAQGSSTGGRKLRRHSLGPSRNERDDQSR